MGVVVQIGGTPESDMLAACDELRARVASGEIHSLMALVHIQGDRVPKMVVMGGFQEDLYGALTALERARIHVHRLMDGTPAARDFMESSQAS